MVEAEQHGASALGGAQDAHRRLGHDAKLALVANDQAEQVETGRVELRAADVENGPVDQNHFDAKNVICRDAMLETMRAAAVHADVAGDGAGELRGGVGRVEKSVGHDRVGDAEIGHAGLHARHAVGVIDLENFV